MASSEHDRTRYRIFVFDLLFDFSIVIVYFIYKGLRGVGEGRKLLQSAADLMAQVFFLYFVKK